jgi:hypothetical protein
MAPGARSLKASLGRGRSGERERQSAVSSVQTQPRERQVGDLFEYGIEKPVTVRRNQSALVPIVLKPFAGRSVLLYQKAARAENPIRCVEFENTTGLTLEGGPVTVLEEGSYVGEAMLDTLKPGEKRLVGYAVQLAVRVLDNLRGFRQNVCRVVVRAGTLVTYFGQAQQTTYTFTSKAEAEQLLYLDHPRPGGDWELFDTPAPHEVTENYWRFRFPLPPHASTNFVVNARSPQSQSFALSGVTDSQLAAWVESRFIDQKTEAALRESFRIRHEVAGFEEKLQQLAAERNQIHAEQPSATGRARRSCGNGSSASWARRKTGWRASRPRRSRLTATGTAPGLASMPTWRACNSRPWYPGNVVSPGRGRSRRCGRAGRGRGNGGR